MTERFVYFWGGPFSQWHMANFTRNGITYNCAEQFMMHTKAVLCADPDTAEKILAAKTPKEQKALGREVANFDEKFWLSVARRVVYVGNLEKFKQNPQLLKVLLATRGATLVEASPVDRLWGIGLKADDPRAQSRASWRGRNWLGEVLTALRTNLEKNQN